MAGWWNRLRQRSTEPEERAVSFTWPAASNWGRSYQEIDATTGENSLQSIAFRSAADLIASVVSELPIEVFSGHGSAKRLRPTPGNLEDPAGDGHGAEDWAYQAIMSWILRGNLYGNIVDQGPTRMLRQVDLFHPDSVNVWPDGDGGWKWVAGGQEIPERRMLHRRVNPVPGRLLGLSVVHQHAADLKLSLSTTAFGVSWFQDGGHPGGILSNTEADMADDRLVQKAKDRFMAALFGTREPIVLGRGWKYDQIQVAPEESQFLQTQKWSEAQCAHILGPGLAEILGYESGGSMTYSNIIDRDLTMLKYAIGKWIRRIERLYGMFTPRPQYVRLNRDALLETSAMQRWQVNKLKLETGAYVINEIRDEDDKQPVEWGKEPYSMKSAEPVPEPADPADPADPNAGGAQ